MKPTLANHPDLIFKDNTVNQRQKTVFSWLNVLSLFSFMAFELTLVVMGRRGNVISTKVWIIESAYFFTYIFLLAVVNPFLLRKKYTFLKNGAIFILYSVGVAAAAWFILFWMVRGSFQRPGIGVAIVFYVHSVILCCLALINALIKYYIIHINSLREKEYDLLVMDKRMLSLENQLIHQAVDYHFVNNILSSLYHQSRFSDPVLADKLIDLTGIIEYAESVMEHKGALVKMDEELEQLSLHRALLASLYAERPIAFEMNILDEDKSTKVMPLLFSELLQNMYKHGNWNTASGNVYYHVRLTGRVLEIETCNPVKQGNNRKPKEGFGLRSIKEQLEYLYPGNHSFKTQQTELNFTVYLKICL